MRIDLHTHSTASDGTDTPAELVLAAAEAGLDVVALTDHDTSAGWERAAAALPPGLRLVRGSELSCVCPDGRGGQCTVHLLAYFYDPAAPALVAEQARLRAQRRVRLRAMAERMAEDGFPVRPEQIIAELPADASAGRPHLAAALLRAGVVASVDEAFARYLTAGGPYHLSRTDTPVHDAIGLIAAAGGVTVLAHPYARRRGRVVTAEVIAQLAGLGMSGIEVDHPDHDQDDRARLRSLAADLGLVVTGSSDYHGRNKSIRLGQETTSPGMFEALRARAGRTT